MDMKNLYQTRSDTTQSLYFAYGSNLSLDQMRVRCPHSRYIGRARLPDYRWQINQRGFANVVPEPGSFVEGLCYILTFTDEARLDRNEGVPVAYEKIYKEVEVFPATAALYGRDVDEIVTHQLVKQSQPNFQHEVVPLATNKKLSPIQQLRRSHPQLNLQKESVPSLESEEQGIGSSGISQPDPSQKAKTVSLPTNDLSLTNFQQPPTAQKEQTSSLIGEERRLEKRKIEREEPPMVEETPHSQTEQPVLEHGEITLALVYVSHHHTRDDRPRDEYVERMRQALGYALRLGISQDYITSVITPYLPSD